MSDYIRMASLYLKQRPIHYNVNNLLELKERTNLYAFYQDSRLKDKYPY